jgi:hypothetical protein
MWAVQHIEANRLIRWKQAGKEILDLEREEVTKQSIQNKKEIVQTIVAKDRKKKGKSRPLPFAQDLADRKRLEDAPEVEDGWEEEDKLFTATRLTGHQLFEMIQQDPSRWTGGLLINHLVDDNVCDMANNVTITTEEIVAMDLGAALESEPVERPYYHTK